MNPTDVAILPTVNYGSQKLYAKIVMHRNWVQENH